MAVFARSSVTRSNCYVIEYKLKWKMNKEDEHHHTVLFKFVREMLSEVVIRLKTSVTIFRGAPTTCRD